MTAERTNGLAGETSPYLLQHVHNPVDWQPWSEEALERACREDKPRLLSIGVAALVLGRLIGEPRYLDAAERTLKGVWPSILQIPYAHNTLLLALDEALSPPELIVLHGEPAQIEPWPARCRLHYNSRRLVFPVPARADGLTGHLAQCVPRGDAVAYICRDLSCSAPVTRLEELDAVLSRTEVAVAPAAERIPNDLG